MDFTKSPERFIAEMMDSIELVVIELPLPVFKIRELVEENGDPSSVTQIASQSSSQNSVKTLKTRSWQVWWAAHVSVIIPPNGDVRDYLGRSSRYLLGVQLDPSFSLRNYIPRLILL